MNRPVADCGNITAVVLAGGEARRMGGVDKGFVRIGGRAMVEYVLEALRPQVHEVVINANRSLAEYRRYGCRIVSDELPGFNGPLAGMASGLRHIDTAYMVTAPCDSPLVPADLVARLSARLNESGAEIAVAHNGERMQPVFCLMETRLLDSLLEFLGRGERKIDRWFAMHRTVVADFSDSPETFLNVNTPEDVTRIETLLRENDHARV